MKCNILNFIDGYLPFFGVQFYPSSCPHFAGCSTAVNDLVYIMDGSWSVGSDDFETAKHWLINVTSGFDVSSRYSQVGVVQYSDTPRLEIPLGLHKTTQDLIKAIEDIGYLGGNTQTGRAIKFAVDHIFASSQRSEVKNRIAVVVTDGKSQDDVMDASIEARAQGIKMFAVGVGMEITTSELVTIANKPEGEYVLYAEDYTNIERIRDAMEQKLCEGEIRMRVRLPIKIYHIKSRFWHYQSTPSCIRIFKEQWTVKTPQSIHA